jgi:arsenical pump membrane protein
VAIVVEWVVIVNHFGVAEEVLKVSSSGEEPARRLPRFAVAVLALTLLGFALSSALSVAPVWIAVAGGTVLNLPALRGGFGAVGGLGRAVEPGFLIFVLGLGVIVAAASRHGLGSAVRDLLPAGGTLIDLLAIAVVAAVLANVVNNIPATLILMPVAAALGTGPVLAVLMGVNVGPNLTPVGSLATLLWLRVLAADGIQVQAREFVRLGLLSVPPVLVLATVALWLTLRLGV